MDYTLKAGTGLGYICFTDKEKDIQKKLGIPDRTDTELFDDNSEGITDKTVYYDYFDFGIRLKFNYFNGKFDGLTISAEKVVYNNSDLFAVSLDEIMELMKQIHDELKVEFQCDTESYQLSDTNESCYDFDQIGITLWFTDYKLNDVYLYKPEN